MCDRILLLYKKINHIICYPSEEIFESEKGNYNQLNYDNSYTVNS